MAYRLVRTLVYKRGVGIRETVWVGAAHAAVLSWASPSYHPCRRRTPRCSGGRYLVITPAGGARRGALVGVAHGARAPRVAAAAHGGVAALALPRQHRGQQH
eukprot:scaffold15823_cov53-Phaeocystis_antarctica.AAC.3